MGLFFKDEQVKKIMEYMNDGIQIVNEKGMLVYCNQKAAMLDDINISEAIGRHVTEVYPSLNQTDSTILKVLTTGEPIINREQSYRNYKGKLIDTINTTIPIYDSGKVVGAVEISQNMTAYRQLTERYIDLQKQVTPAKENRGKLRATKAVHYYQFEDIITDNPAFNHVKTIAMKAARTEMPVLIYGATGTGKEMLAQAIHSSSRRGNETFIAQNCAALPSSLLEGILFGTVKGGFTGAVDRPGLFELADQGTLFLDEINSMPLPLQAKLLRVLQEKRMRRIGDNQEKKIEVRVIAAMNEDPDKAIEEGQLRRDLYYRLNTIMLSIPRLRDRKEDIKVLTHYFIKKYNQSLYRNVKGVSPEVMRCFEAHSWEGNVRELEHVIESAIHFIEGNVIQVEDLPANFDCSVCDKTYESQGVDLSLGLSHAVEKAEKQMILHALGASDNNVSQAALVLKIPRQTLQYKMKKYQINKQ